ncbi:phage tail terminator protein [Chachezhania antarctica]|uniref:phage tail terminator protein n=1 Tax=Chachezhania antarctica TaxID=2340860 RepID=UPI000EB4BECE|nr:hypothetical protein [Chachezhania antarctica]|tara:strand:- start:811 stop:1242 length:432 start_codon:yes stop_codon:yes gene_type:complete
MIDLVIARLKAEVADLGGRVEGAASFATLMQQNALPQVTPAAHVLPVGLTGGRANAATGMFTQLFDEAVGVILTIRGHDQTGGRSLDLTEALIRAVIEAVAGWEPADEIGSFRLVRGNLVSLRAGALIYQLDFSITDQLRIPT